MKNISRFLTVLVSCFCIYKAGSMGTLQGSTATENIEIRVFNHDYKAKVGEVLSKLGRAQLEFRGFTKSVINKSSVTADEKPLYSTLLQFDKTVPCKRLLTVEQEIRRLLPGVWGVDVSKRVVSTVSRTMFDGEKICTAGIEIHLPSHGSHAGRKTKRDACDEWCLFCFHAATKYRF